jgi:hypothetical protein
MTESAVMSRQGTGGHFPIRLAYTARMPLSCHRAPCREAFVDLARDGGADFHHSGTTRTGPNDMVAAYMLLQVNVLQVHGWAFMQ